MSVVNSYLDKLSCNSCGRSDIQKITRGLEVTTYSRPEDIKTGLLRFNTPPDGKAFIFRLGLEKVVAFHTKGMKFNIDIFFFDGSGKLVTKYLNVKPGVDNISSLRPCKFAVEIASK